MTGYDRTFSKKFLVIVFHLFCSDLNEFYEKNENWSKKWIFHVEFSKFVDFVPFFALFLHDWWSTQTYFCRIWPKKNKKCFGVCFESVLSQNEGLFWKKWKMTKKAPFLYECMPYFWPFLPEFWTLKKKFSSGNNDVFFKIL